MTVNRPTALRLATSLLACDGLAALYLGGLLGAVGAATVALAIAAAWRNEPVRDRVSAVPGLGRGVVLLAAGLSAFDVLYLASSALDGLARLLVFLLLYRLFMRERLRDLRDVAVLAFFMLVAAAPLTVGVGFLFTFLIFLVVGTWMLMLYHVAGESERAGGSLRERAAPPGLGRDLFALSVAASVATLAITAALFFVIPRVGQAALMLRTGASRLISGFSDRVELGAFGEIETDATVVMRVHLPGRDVVDPARLPDLRWRGLALDRYDGRAWTTARRERATAWRSPSGQFDLRAVRRPGPVLTQEIYLEPLGTDVLFAAPRLLGLQVRAATLVVDDMDGVSMPVASARFRYLVRSELESDARGGGRPLDAAARARFLQLPPLSARVGALAREITAGQREPRDAALALTGHLASRYRYSRALRPTTSLDPVEEFLFVRRSGNCEYFAASLAVMLRSLGIPARVVNGFQRGEWNPYGGYFMVRLLDAHSWVEAWVDGDWMTLDPSPRAPGEATGAPGDVSLYLDALRVRWYRYVVNWSLQDQVMTALQIRETALAWTPNTRALREWREPPREIFVVLGLGVLAGALLVRRRLHPRTAAGAKPAVPRFYTRALRALARRRLAPGAGETAREFARRVARVVPRCADPFARITEAYERVRFGARPLRPEEVTIVGDRVAEVRRHLASFSSAAASAWANRTSTSRGR